MYALLAAALLDAYAMPADAFNRLKDQVEDEGFASGKTRLIATAASTNTFTASQVAQLLEEIPFAKNQLEALRAVASRIEDPANQSVILEAFSFSSDQSKARQILSSATPAAPAPLSSGGALATVSTFNCPVDASLPALELNYSSTWPNDAFAQLLTQIDGEAFSSNKLDILRSQTRARPDSFSGGQIRRLLEAYDFSDDLEDVVRIVEPRLEGLTVAEVAHILEAFSFSSAKLAALRTLKATITDAEHKHELLSSFTHSSDKEKASRILEEVVPRSALYGSVDSRRAVFVIDTSGSMDARFRTNQGRSMTRLDFVRCELASVVNNQLGPGTQYDIIAFSGGVDSLFGGLAPIDAPSIGRTNSYLASLRPSGATNIYGALEQAFARQPDTIYFLTDGAPTAGATTSPRAIVQAVAQWSQGRVAVHSVAFLTGSDASDDKSASRRLMREIANASGGTYRAVE